MKWLERQDVAERAQWVADFRDSEDTLGTVITETMRQRDAHWSSVELLAEGDRKQPPKEKEQMVKSPKAQGGTKPQTQEDIIAGYKCCLTLKDGTRLCRAFQTGECKNKGPECPNGIHGCAVITNATGRVCGMRNHGASQHRQ